MLQQLQRNSEEFEMKINAKETKGGVGIRTKRITRNIKNGRQRTASFQVSWEVF